MKGEKMHTIDAAAELLDGVGVARPEIEDAVGSLLKAFGEDACREGLERTPERVARMYDELLAGYRVDPYELINEAVFRSLGVPIGFLSALVIGVFTAIANFFTITPNNLGIQEAVIAYLLSVTGFDFATGVIGAGLSRVIHMIITFSLAPLFMHTLFKSENLKLTGILQKSSKIQDTKPDAI